MILVYPVGIPATFVHLLFKHREKINPPAATEARSTPPTVRMAAFPKRRACITPNELFLTDIPASDAPVTIPSLSRDQNMGVRAGEEMKESREVGGGNGGDDRAGQRNGVTGEVYIFGQLSSRPTNTNREEVRSREHMTFVCSAEWGKAGVEITDGCQGVCMRGWGMRGKFPPYARKYTMSC